MPKPKKYEREIEQLLNDISDLNTDNKHSTVTQLPKVINNQLSKIGSLIGSLLTNPRNRLVTLLLSTVSLIALTTMLPGVFSSVLWIVLIILIMKFSHPQLLRSVALFFFEQDQIIVRRRTNASCF